MKYKDSKTIGLGCDNYNVISVLCETINDAARQEALNSYLESSAHSYGLLAGHFADNCRKELKRVKAGKPSPQPPFACCPGCFEDLLSTPMHLTYPVLTPALDENDKAWDTVPINEAPDGSDVAALEDFLLHKAHAECETAYAPTPKDTAAREDYVETFRNLLRTAASLAKRLSR